MNSTQTPATFQEAIRYFSNPDAALDFVAGLRWPSGVTCPRCGAAEPAFLRTRRVWNCKACRKQFSAKVGTVMEDSPIGLDKWLPCLWLVVNCKNGVSSYEIARDLGVTQKTAWFMAHRARLAMQSGTFETMSGEVEVDETYIGGKARFMHSSKRRAKITGTGGKDKAAVMGLLQRHSAKGHSIVKVRVVPNVRRATVSPEIRANVAEGSEVFTDALKSYNDLGADFVHKVIDHAERYVDGRVHTNGLENFWSLLKRSIRGTYTNVEPFHLFRYLDEQSFRFNARKLTDGVRFVIAAAGIFGKRLTYQELIGAEATT
jgi:transposase-like protein